jgi:hypothetical protein
MEDGGVVKKKKMGARGQGFTLFLAGRTSI